MPTTTRDAEATTPAASPLDLTLTRRVWAQWPFVVGFAGRVFALQSTHPVVSRGLEDHSDIFTDGPKRSERTLAYAMKLIYADDPAAVLAELREMHRPIRGRMEDGRQYHAWNPGPWAWVHLSNFDAVRHGRRLMGRPLTRAQEEQLYAETLAVGRGYGVRDQPEDLAAYERYLRETIDTVLEPTYTSDRLWNAAIPAGPPLPPGAPAAVRLAWPVARRGLGALNRVMLAGSFPPELRRMLGVRWTPVHRIVFLGMVATLRAVVALAPADSLLFPAARRALTPAERAAM